MNKILLYVTLSIFVFGCSRQQPVVACSESQLKAVSVFVQQNIKDANNMSDEEMEDVVLQLERTGIKTLCGTQIMSVRDGYIEYDKIAPLPGFRYFNY